MFCFCCHPSKRLCSSVFLWDCLFSIQMCLFFSVCLSICLYVAFLPFKVLVSIQFILLNVVLFAADAVLLIMEDCSSNIFCTILHAHMHTHIHIYTRNTHTHATHTLSPPMPIFYSENFWQTPSAINFLFVVVLIKCFQWFTRLAFFFRTFFLVYEKRKRTKKCLSNKFPWNRFFTKITFHSEISKLASNEKMSFVSTWRQQTQTDILK